jgi:predicted PurR-regulated permease PerM
MIWPVMQPPRNILEFVKFPWVRICLEALALLLALWVLHRLSGVLTPVGIGLALAYMVEPLVNWFERRRIARRYAAGAVFGGGALFLALVVALAIPVAWTEGVKLYRVGFQGDHYIDQHGPFSEEPDGIRQPDEVLDRDLNGNGRYDPSQIQVLKQFLVSKGWIQDDGFKIGSSFGFDPEAWLRDQLAQFSNEDGRILFGKVSDVLGRIGFWGIALLLIPIYAYFFSLHLATVSNKIIDHIPRTQRDRTLRILREINAVIGAFFRGRLTICAILGVVASIGFGIANTPSFILLGLFMGLATAIPLASGLVLLPVAMLLYLGGADTWQYVAVAVTYGVVQGLEPILISAIMGKGVEMHPVLIVVAILAFGALLGGVGVLLAVPLAATARILFREFVYPHLRRIAGLDEPQSLLGNDPTAGA